MTTRAAKKAPAGKAKAFSDQSRHDYPDHVYEATGKDFYAKLAIRKEVEDVNKDSDANDGNDSVKVFQRKAPSKVLLKTKDLCNGYF